MTARAKWTPGPWAAKDAHPVTYSGKGETRQAIETVYVTGPGGRQIARVEDGLPGDTDDTDRANANLIAAAPALVAVVEKVAALKLAIGDSTELTDAVFAARAALALAQGGK